jgi:hypothetical protein
MKSVKVFLLCMLALYTGLFIFDYLKAVVYPVKHHSLVIWLKTFFLVSAGILIMWLTLEKRVFKTFLVIYLALWAIYYIIKLIAKFPTQVSENALQAHKVMLFYLNITQLLTPFPFFFFWVVNRVFRGDILNTNQSKKES